MARYLDTNFTGGLTGDYVPKKWTYTRTMKAGVVKLRLRDVTGAHPFTGAVIKWNSPCHYFVEMIDSLTDNVVGGAHIYKTWGVTTPYVTLGTLLQTRSIRFRIRASVTYTGTCPGCGPGYDDFYLTPVYNTFKGDLEYEV